MTPPPELAALLSRGWTTREELLQTAFGGPVPGIAADPEPVRFPLVFKELEKFEHEETLGSACGDRFRFGHEKSIMARHQVLHPSHTPFIEFRSDLDPAIFAQRIVAHEGLHILQLDDLLTDTLIAPHRAGKTRGASPSHGHGPHLEAVLASEETPAQTAFRYQHLAFPNAQIPHLKNAEPYYFRALEIEARLAEVFANFAGHGAWKRMPQTRAELDPVLQIFNPAPKQLQIHPDFAFNKRPLETNTLNAIDTISVIRTEVVAKLSPTQQKAFFDKVLPEIYADFLERCGDLDIRAKLGLEPGIPYGRRAGRRMRAEALLPNQNHPWTPEQWKTAAAQAEPETLPGLISLAVELHNNAALPAFLEAYRQRPEFDPARLRTLPIWLDKFSLSKENRALLKEAAPLFRLPFLRHASPSTALEKSVKGSR